MKNLKTLEEHNSVQRESHYHFNNGNVPIKNGISCPKCNSELYDSNPMVTLTSDPPQKDIHCNNCDYRGYRIS